MAEPSAKLKDALRQVEPPWDHARTERTLHALPARRRHKQRRVLSAASLAASLLIALAWVARPPAARLPAGPSPVVVAATPAKPEAPSAAPARANEPDLAEADALASNHDLTLPDGSKVELLAAQTTVALEQNDAHQVSLRMGQGQARFSVTPGLTRVFRVRTEQVSVQVLGTVFELTLLRGQTRVRVEHGRVAVAWRNQGLLARGSARFDRVELVAGQTGDFPPQGRRAGPTPASWREQAERGEFKQAFLQLPSTDTMKEMSVAELLLAADTARLSGHPEAALPWLTRVMRAHPGDARAPLAAFTLGGVLLQQLGRPREAEAAYAEARATTRSEALAQDALARQVEAAHRAGDETRARKLAEEYVTLYPLGRRIHAVRRFGGL
jgi:transmembrane sensor